MSDAIIRVENLSKRYVIGHQRSKKDGLRHVVEEAMRAPIAWLSLRRQQKKQRKEEFWALKDVSFEVKRGEVLGIIGRNGAGKSTLLKILSRITEPTAGEVRIKGRVASLLEVGTGFHQELTGRENIFLNGAILGMSRVEIKRKFDEIVTFSEIEQFIDTPVKRYSSGMYVRLAFAVAAHLEPEILIVDEVLAVGDFEFQKKCMGKMQAVSAMEGRTVLFVSHNTAAIQHLCSHCICLSRGMLMAAGGVEDTIAQYLNVTETMVELNANHLFAIKKCEFISADNEQPTTNLIFNRNYRLIVQFESYQKTRFAIVVEIRDHNGVVVSSINSPEEGHSFPQEKGNYVYDISFKNLILYPGRFTISIRICDHQELFLGQEEVLAITVTPENLPGAAYAYHRNHGYVRIASGSRLLRLGTCAPCV